MQSGGFVKNVFQRTKVYSPSSRKNPPSAAISSEVPLNGASGSFVCRSRTSSTRPKRPIDRRRRPRDGALPGRPAAPSSRRPCARAFSMQVVFFVDLNGRERGRARERMAVVGQPAVEHLVLK